MDCCSRDEYDLISRENDPTYECRMATNMPLPSGHIYIRGCSIQCLYALDTLLEYPKRESVGYVQSNVIGR